MSTVLSKSKLRFFSPFFIFASFCFLYLPILILLIFSFNSRTFPAPWDSFTLDWYKLLFAESAIWSALLNSFTIALASTCICLILSISMLYFLSRGGKMGRFIPLFYGNIIIPDTVLAVGLVSYFTFMHIPLGLGTIIVAHSILGIGFTIPILYLRYREIDPKIFEASAILGASHAQTLKRLVLPLMRPTLISTALVVFILSFDDFILSYFCTGNAVQTLSLFLISSIRYGVSPVINALASILLLLTIVLVTIFFSLKNRTRIL
jgi:spermidine/putrescine transport system permease protein